MNPDPEPKTDPDPDPDPELTRLQEGLTQSMATLHWVNQLHKEAKQHVQRYETHIAEYKQAKKVLQRIEQWKELNDNQNFRFRVHNLCMMLAEMVPRWSFKEGRKWFQLTRPSNMGPNIVVDRTTGSVKTAASSKTILFNLTTDPPDTWLSKMRKGRTTKMKD